MSRPFPAKRAGNCPNCSTVIRVGDTARFDERDRVVHDVCPRAADPPRQSLPPNPLGEAGLDEGPGSWTIEFAEGGLLVRRAFLRNRPPTQREVDEFRAFTREIIK